LDDIPSILETKTRQDTGVLLLPLAKAVRNDSGTEARWLPALTYSYGRTHQFSDTLPINGGFSPGHLPDQESLNHVLSMDWQGNLWRLAATASRSDQDNRQPGRENDDFAAETFGINFSLTPRSNLDLAITLGKESSENLASGETDTTLRTGLNLNWRFRTHSVELMASRSDSDSSPLVRESLTTDFTAQWSWQFGRTRGADSGAGHGFSSRFHLLYSRQTFEASDLVFGFSDQNDLWTVSGGLSISIF
ncbi:MAG: hypothetical protein K8J08_14610, partial [Thermoanaerobaculia bacterium]|nr:hypothetical protein [Thermoanaerobaculia bacterium]